GRSAYRAGDRRHPLVQRAPLPAQCTPAPDDAGVGRRTAGVRAGDPAAAVAGQQPVHLQALVAGIAGMAAARASATLLGRCASPAWRLEPVVCAADRADRTVVPGRVARSRGAAVAGGP